MTIRLDKHPDAGCWISDDRVNAFISASAPGVSELGFHGLQPVSRNSRLLVQPEGVLKVSIRRDVETPFLFQQVEWRAGGVVASVRNNGNEYRLEVRADGRSVYLTVSGPGTGNADVVIRFSLRSLFTDVHGERKWEEPHLLGGMLELRCRDRIVLRDWMKRTGAYAGDFLIPEVWRRKIFRRKCKSGLAAPDDLLPEYRDADIPLYDAETWIHAGGKGFSGVESPGVITFTAPLTSGKAVFAIAFAETPNVFDTPAAHSIPLTVHVNPAIEIPGHDEIGKFFSTVPEIVRSCTLRSNGMTRATPGAYYWIWAWDTMVTGMEMPRWGDARGAERIVRFINGHRDEGGAIPARWTRRYEPLDTPPPGALEFLLLALAAQSAREGAGAECMNDVYPRAVERLRNAAAGADEKGLEPNIGFYPDLPVRFGRSERSAAAMETGATYAFCRLLESEATRRGDAASAEIARSVGRRIEESFDGAYWDEARGFLIDSVNIDTGAANRSYPLFSLMFLQTPLGLPLIRPHIGRMAQFARDHLQTPHGTHLLPEWDERRNGEDALSSWYPHWDIYLLKLLRRGKEREGILTWLHAMERVLARLGYAPEFLRLEGLPGDDDEAWRRHGSVSNLNCATGWYRGILEGLVGIEFDPGGMTLVPLDLDLPRIALRGLIHRGSAWEISVENRGGPLGEMFLDGEPLRGCTKIPSRCHDGRSHRLAITYVEKAVPPRFTEIVNAEILETDGDAAQAEVIVRGMGTVDVAFPLGPRLDLRVDGTTAPYSSDAGTGTGYAQLPLTGRHSLSLRKTD